MGIKAIVQIANVIKMLFFVQGELYRYSNPMMETIEVNRGPPASVVITPYWVKKPNGIINKPKHKHHLFSFFL